MSVLAAAAKKDVVDPRAKACKDAGIDLDGVGLASVGVANVFDMFPPKMFMKDHKDSGIRAVAVLDIGEAGANLMVMAQGIPRFSRDIYIGTGEIIKRLANSTGVPYAETRAALFLGETPSEIVSKTIEAVLTNLASEVALSFDYFVTEKNMTIAGMCLIGEGVGLKGVEAFMAGKFDIPLVMWDPLSQVALAPSAVSLEEGESRKYITALGMALQVYDKD